MRLLNADINILSSCLFKSRRLACGCYPMLQAVFLILLSISLPAIAGFTTKGIFNVNPDGSASYIVPIQVPPGSVGISPELSLNYNSRSGNSNFGIGWGLNGLSEISRCPRTVAQDGVRSGVNYDGNDRFCLDGQRLIASTGVYGANGTQYRTEIANFAKIISYGVAGSGPAWFKIWTKDGRVFEYGNTDDSRIEAAGKATARVWGVNKISNTSGSFMTFSYQDNTSGETYISRLDYTGNVSTSLSPFASVRFTYETRPDVGISYQAGSIIKTTKRVSNIKTYVGETLVRSYNLSYSNMATIPMTRLTTIQECGASASCKLPISIDYPAVADGVFGGRVDSFVFTYSHAEPPYCHIEVADVSGDGKADAVEVCLQDLAAAPAPLLSVTPALSNGDGTFAQPVDTSQTNGLPYVDIQMADVNGDGKVDAVEATTLSVMLSNGNGTFAPVSPYRGGATQMADINGDGKADAMGASADTSGLLIEVSFSNGDTTFASTISNKMSTANFGTGAYQMQAADINGDGKVDVIATYAGPSGLRAYVMLSNGDGTFAPLIGNAPSTASFGDIGNYQMQFADVNGDGKVDVMATYVGPSGIRLNVMLSQGDGTFSPIIASAPSTSSYGDIGTYRIRWADVNGDGKADAIATTASSGVKAYVMLSNGDGTFAPIIANQFSPDSVFDEVQVVDVNGDGKADAIWGFGGYNMMDSVVLAPSSQGFLANAIRPGLDAVINIAYKPITDNGVYIKDSGVNASAYPLQDVQNPTYVVSSVSSTDGIGGLVTTNYQYGGLKFDTNGRGLLGFRWIKVSNPDRGIVNTSFFRQDFPYIGLLSQTEKRLISSNVLLSASQQTYANINLTTDSAISKFPYVSQSVEQNYELSGILTSAITTTSQYDNYGNPTQVTMSSNDGYTKTITNTYINDTASWLLGRLLKSTLTSTTP